MKTAHRHSLDSLCLSALLLALAGCGGGGGTDSGPDGNTSTSLDSASGSTNTAENTAATPATAPSTNTTTTTPTTSTVPTGSTPTGSGTSSGTASGTTGGTTSTTSTTSTLTFCSEKLTIAEVMAKINAARSVARSCGSTSYAAAPPLTWNAKLAAAATKQANDMAQNNFFSHTGSDGSTLGTRVSATGYNFKTVGENIAAGQSTMDAAIAGWLASPGHCANIMNPNFKDYGIACAANSSAQYKIYWTQVFGASF